MADEKNEIYFKLTNAGSTSVSLDFGENFENLNFSTSQIKDFIWNATDTSIDSFDDSDVFTDISERYIGYDPLNRDRLEIRILVANLNPVRIALGGSYAGLVASLEKRKFLGAISHSNDFGEIMVASDASGVVVATRVSAIRRGSQLLIIQTRIRTEFFDAYANSLAEFLGSIKFASKEISDPIVETFWTQVQEIKSKEIYRIPMPPHWQSMQKEVPAEFDVSLQIYRDTSYPRSPSFIMPIAFAAAESDLLSSPEKVKEYAISYLNLLFENLELNSEWSADIESGGPVEGFSKSAENAIGLHLLVDIDSFEEKYNANILLSEKRGRLVGYVSISLAPSDLFFRGLSNHATYVSKLASDAISNYWDSLAQ